MAQLNKLRVGIPSLVVYKLKLKRWHDASLQQAGAQNSQSPVDAQDGPGDGTSMLSRVPGSLVSIAHFLEKSALEGIAVSDPGARSPRMSETGQSRPNWAIRIMSGLPPIATVDRTSRLGRSSTFSCAAGPTSSVIEDMQRLSDCVTRMSFLNRNEQALSVLKGK